jgi:hypothetical protein
MRKKISLHTKMSPRGGGSEFLGTESCVTGASAGRGRDGTPGNAPRARGRPCRRGRPPLGKGGTRSCRPEGGGRPPSSMGGDLGRVPTRRRVRSGPSNRLARARKWPGDRLRGGYPLTSHLPWTTSALGRSPFSHLSYPARDFTLGQSPFSQLSYPARHFTLEKTPRLTPELPFVTSQLPCTTLYLGENPLSHLSYPPSQLSYPVRHLPWRKISFHKSATLYHT